MKKLAAVFAAIMIMAGASLARAGVVITEQQSTDRGDGQSVTHNRTLFVQGNKQKSVDERGGVIVTDLDGGVMTIMNTAHKSYIQLPFPPQGSMAAMMTGGTSRLSFKKTGTKQKIAGYSCDDYTGSGKMQGNEYSVKGCFSTSAPGAKEFTAFQKKMAAKVKGTPMAMMGEMPPGVPLKIDSSTKITHVAMPGMSPEQAEKMSKMLAGRPPIVTHTTVTKVTAQDLAADTFAPPAGYQRQEMPKGPPMGGGIHGTSGGPETSKPGAPTPKVKVPE